MCAIGNILRSEDVPQAMVEAFGQDPRRTWQNACSAPSRLGLAAGGELKQVKSAALVVVHEQAFPLVDLRVELNPQPLAQLRLLWERYRPQLELYVRRAIDPDSVPYPEV